MRSDSGDNYGASLDFSKAIKVNPKNYEAFFNRAKVFKNMEKFKDAELDLSTALKYNPNFAEGFVLRALLNFELWDYRQVIRDCETATNINHNLKNKLAALMEKAKNKIYVSAGNGK